MSILLEGLTCRCRKQKQEMWTHSDRMFGRGRLETRYGCLRGGRRSGHPMLTQPLVAPWEH